MFLPPFSKAVHSNCVMRLNSSNPISGQQTRSLPNFKINFQCFSTIQDPCSIENISAYAVVYSVSDLKSFINACHTVDHLKKNISGPAAIILVANKTDMVRIRVVSEYGKHLEIIIKKLISLGSRYLVSFRSNSLLESNVTKDKPYVGFQILKIRKLFR